LKFSYGCFFVLVIADFVDMLEKDD